jgi:hypothetical protein
VQHDVVNSILGMDCFQRSGAHAIVGLVHEARI